MMRFARHIALLFALGAATPALAQDWRVAAISGAKPGRTVYLVDSASIVRTGNTLRFTTQSIFETLTEARDFDRSITKRLGDCTTISSAIVENSYYAKGALLNTDKTAGANLLHKEGTVMNGVLQKACGLKPLEAGTIADPEAIVRAYFAKPVPAQ